MAAPVDANRIASTSGGTAEATPITVSLPTGIVSGDLLVIWVVLSNSELIATPATGWTKLFQDSDNIPTNHDNIWGTIVYRVADGSEGSTVDLSMVSGSVKWCACAWRITGADVGAGTFIQASADSNQTSGNSPDPPSITPSGGAKDYLILWCGLCSSVPVPMPPTGSPSGYSNPFGSQAAGSGSASTKPNAFGASKQLSAATTEDAPAWTISTSALISAHTIAIYPLSGTVYTDSATVNIDIQVNSLEWREPGDTSIPSFRVASVGDVMVSGSKDTNPIVALAADELIILHTVQGGITGGTVTLDSVTNLKKLDGTTGMDKITGVTDIGSAATGRHHIWIGRSVAAGPCYASMSTTGEDIFRIMYSFLNTGAGTTQATVFENTIAGGSTSVQGTSATAADAGVQAIGSNRLALNLEGVLDDNVCSVFTGQTGGTWVLETQYQEAGGTQAALALQTARMPTAATINGGTGSITGSAGWGAVGFALLGTGISTDASTVPVTITTTAVEVREIPDTGTVLVPVGVTSTETREIPDAATVLVDISVTGTELREITDAATMLIDIQTSGSEAAQFVEGYVFPRTSVIDNYDRANESPLSQAGLWLQAGTGSGSNRSLRLVSNTVQGTVDNVLNAMFRAGPFGPDCEAYVDYTTLSDADTYIRLVLRASGLSGDNWNGYVLQWSNDGNGARVYKDVAGTLTVIAQDAALLMNAGDQIGFSAIANTLTVYRNRAAVLSVNDTTYTAAGDIALGYRANSGALDNFGGGTVVMLAPVLFKITPSGSDVYTQPQAMAPFTRQPIIVGGTVYQDRSRW